MNETDRRTFMKQSAGAMAAVALLPELGLARPVRLLEPMTVGVIGAGRQGRAILGELQKMEGVAIGAICDVDERRLDAGVRRSQGAEGFADYRAMLDKRADVKAVVIATPTHLHRDIALAALAAGRHVYCETPLAHTVEDCQAIARAARGSSGVFHSGLQGRSNPVYKLAWTFFRSEAVRDPVAMRAQSNRKNSWRTPAPDPARDREFNWRLDPAVSLGLAGEQGTQQFDVFHWYLGAYPVRAHGGGSIRLHADGREVHDTIHCGLDFESGVHLHYEATLASTYGGEYEVLHGTNASMWLAWTHGWMFKESDAPTQGWEVYANRQRFHNDQGITLIAEATKLAAQGKLQEGIGLPNSPLYYALGDFLRSVSEGAPVVCGADEGARASIVGILANRAVVTGGMVEIDPALLRGG
ncbi:MAG TPA: Gfo/Idh/MocA family oxidoreductase [Phycisphaerales bacterium]|nr:Gfo/Idh/MocA family oxidoreductase [Phycisphaerales bacterium]